MKSGKVWGHQRHEFNVCFALAATSWTRTPRAAIVEADRLDDAQAEIADIQKISPDYTVGLVEEIYIYNRAQDRELFLNGLRNAGLPE